MSEQVSIRVSDVQPGQIVAFDRHEPVWVTVLKVKRDSYGYDMLYAPDGDEPRWHGFPKTGTVVVRH